MSSGMTSAPNRMKELIGKVAGGRALTLEEARDAFDIMMSGDATPAQVGGFLMAMRVRGETVDELTGGALAMRAAHGHGQGAGRCDRYLRHRRRCVGDLQHVDRRGPGGRGLRRAGRQARQPRPLVQVRVGRRAGRAGGQHRCRGRPCRAGDRGDADRLHDGAAPSWCDAPCRRRQGRARHPHHLQSARTARQSGQRQAAADRRLRRGLGGADGPCAGPARLGAGLGRARLRRPGRDHDDRAVAGRRAARRQGALLRGHARAGGPAEGPARGSARRRCRDQRPGGACAA